ncbi:hypothetical protein JCM33374_g4098 [Metschnikowia sp. JCM 33374]|nr:hypothetical protein JCM33374_g4098 [Metschnikowia sp. JCM 33374]
MTADKPSEKEKLALFQQKKQYSETEDTPPSYSDIQPPLQIQEFVFRFAGDRFKAFPSEKSMEIYEDAKKLSRSRKHTAQFFQAKEYQNQSIGLPLLVAQHSSSMGLGETDYLTLFDCKSKPEQPNKLYSKKDDQKVARVHMQSFLGYRRFRIQFAEVNFLVFSHLRHPIVDFNIGNERFRFVKLLNRSEGLSSSVPFLYKIYLLDSHQPSLVDNLNSDLTINKTNPLLGSRTRNFFGRTPRPSEQASYASSFEYGTLEGISGGLFSKVKKCATLRLHNPVSGCHDANDSVDFKAGVFVAVSLVLQTQDMQRDRANAINTMNTVNTTNAILMANNNGAMMNMNMGAF